MRNSVAPIIVFMVVGLWFLISAASGERAEQPRRPYEELDKRDFPCSDKWWLYPLTRDRVFRSLGLTTEQREEVGRLRKQFRDSLLDLKRRHNESLLNVLDDNQRRKLEEKKGEIDRYLRDRSPYQHYRRRWPSRDGSPSNDDNFNDLNLLEVGTSKKLTESDYPYANIDPTTWGVVKNYFKE